MVELDWNQNWGGMATKQLGQLARMANRRRDQLDERTSRLSRHEMTHGVTDTLPVTTLRMNQSRIPLVIRLFSEEVRTLGMQEGFALITSYHYVCS